MNTKQFHVAEKESGINREYHTVRCACGEKFESISGDMSAVIARRMYLCHLEEMLLRARYDQLMNIEGKI